MSNLLRAPKNSRRSAVLPLLLITSGTFQMNMADADEGMWQPHQLPQIAKKLKKAGLKLSPKKLTSLTDFPMGAIVSLGGCSASFVSDIGLVVTNHHCAYGSIQYNSTKDNNLLENGFLASTLTEELPATPGSKIYVTENIQEVTEAVTQGITASMEGEARYKLIDDNQKRLVADCESNKDYRCSVVNFHGGLEYFLFKQLMIRDVRLVHAPASSIGKYGGDIDNWMWPRHTGDYSFLRAYVGKDGKPADFSKDNVPYQPKHHLTVNAKGVDDGDFIMVLGYPGRTNRYRTASEVKFTFNEAYPESKRIMGDLIDIIKTHSQEGSDARIKYESLLAGLANYEKNQGSMMESYHKGTTQSRKDTFNNDLRNWINQDEQRKIHYGEVLDSLEALIAESNKRTKAQSIIGRLGLSQMVRVSNRLYQLAIEKQKASDIERDRGYQERDWPSIEQSMRVVNRRYEATIDQAMLEYILTQYSKLPTDERSADIDQAFGIVDGMNPEDLAETLSELYAKTTLNQEATRLAWMEKPPADFEKSDDPFIQIAVATKDGREAREKKAKKLSGEFQAIRSKYMEAVIAYYQSQNLPVYADANSTLRVTYGNVKGYTPQDGLRAVPFTTLEGIAAKDTGDKPFNSPKKQLALIENKTYGQYKKKGLNSVPVNFLGTLDITGGNSGSATLNNKAELVGLIFDGVYESIIGDWDYDPKLNRSIHVDIRYMLWVMENVDGAHNLIKEMDIKGLR